jgi:SAM-dependent methyltransferase
MSDLDLQDRREHIRALLVPLLSERARRLRILDLGCGTGDVLSGLPRDRAAVVGVDLSPEMLARAAVAHPDDRFAASDAARLPFRAASFDLVVSAGMLEYASQPTAVLREVRELLRPDGRLILSMPNRASLFRKLSRLEEGVERPLARAARRGLGRPPAPAALGFRHNQWSVWSGRRLLRECGFQPERVLFNTYGMRGWLGSLAPSLRFSAWMTRRFAASERVSALLAHTLVFEARRA